MSELDVQLLPIVSMPGIKRDGARLSGNNFVDGQWCRFRSGAARKIGGYKEIYHGNQRIFRSTFVMPSVPNFKVFVADSNTVGYFPIDQSGSPIGALVDRTPNGFLTNPDNIWQFDSLFVTTNNYEMIFAHAAPNLSYIDNTVEAPVYFGSANLNIPLEPTGYSVSGGIVVLNPYLVMYGNNGQVKITWANDPTKLHLDGRITSQKIVYGLPVRAGSNSPGGLLWSLDSLIRMSTTTIAGVPTFAFDTVTTESSILSSSSVIEYDGKFFWCGIDRFLVYNGTVVEVLNDKCLLWFYKNLNYQYRQKVWATKNPESGEIWWWFPFGNSTECNAKVIFNIRENSWSSGFLDIDDLTVGRASGYYEQVFSQPIWADLAGNVWLHEEGVNKVDINGNISAIKSYFETGDISYCATGPTGNWEGKNRWTNLEWIEPEFWEQSGNITLTVRGQEYPNSPIINATTATLTPTTTKQDLKVQQRYMTLKFESNEIDGFYELGQTLLAFTPGDVRS